MSLPTAKAPAQSSIKSFFSGSSQQRPSYTPPPPSSDSTPPPPPPAAPLVASRPLPKEANTRSITSDDITPLRRINSLLLPVAFPDAFYDAALNNPYSRVITWAQDGEAEKVVGAVVCKLEEAGSPTDPTSQNLYIRSLCLLSPYRSLGLMNAALDSVVAAARADSSVDVRTFTAHVWTENDEGLSWYRKRGFTQSEPIQDYYLKLRPGSAYLVTKQIRANVRSSLPPAATSSPSGPPPSTARPPSTTAAIANMPQAVNFQNRRPETEWNDLPADMAPGLLIPPPRRNMSEANSNASSRSSSAAKKKKDRYPAAAFGN